MAWCSGHLTGWQQTTHLGRKLGLDNWTRAWRREFSGAQPRTRGMGMVPVIWNPTALILMVTGACRFLMKLADKNDAICKRVRVRIEP